MTVWVHKRIVLEVDALVADGFDDADVNDYMQLTLSDTSTLSSLDVDVSAVKVQRVRTRAIAIADEGVTS